MIHAIVPAPGMGAQCCEAGIGHVGRGAVGACPRWCRHPTLLAGMATAACPGGPVAGDAAAFAATVQERYAGLRPFYSNLLDDLGATDTFVIDGDALMLELLGGERMDWRSGGQFLALRAELERFVAGINAANTAHLKWWTVFFNSNSALLPGAAAQAARALAQAWLPGALGVQTLRFDSWWCADWLAWVEATRPAMLLLTDLPLGSEGRSSIAGAGIAGPGDSSDSGAACLQERRLFLQAYVVHAQGEAGLQCAFISELRFLAEGLIFGFRTGWTSAAAAGRRRDTTPAEAAAAVGQAFLDCPTAAAAAAAAGQALAAQVLDLNALPLQIASQAPPGEGSCSPASPVTQVSLCCWPACHPLRATCLLLTWSAPATTLYRRHRRRACGAGCHLLWHGCNTGSTQHAARCAPAVCPGLVPA